jgi:hypothetical protein
VSLPWAKAVPHNHHVESEKRKNNAAFVIDMYS